MIENVPYNLTFFNFDKRYSLLYFILWAVTFLKDNLHLILFLFRRKKTKNSEQKSN
jgi:hypothetical protein